MKIKRWISVLLVLCMAVSMMPVSAMAVSEIASGTCGENLTWVLTDDGTLTISGTGPMTDYSSSSPSSRPWNSWRHVVKNTVIEDGVTSIGHYAFQLCDSLASVTIPDSITSVSIGAFRGCTSLNRVTIPDSVTTIDEGAFASCGLTSVTIHDNVTSIGKYAFAYCHNLIGIYVNKNNSYYSNDSYGALLNKSETSLIQVPGGIQGHYSIPDSVTSISVCAFETCAGLTSVTIGNSVISIGLGAFTNCDSLISVTIPDSVTSISDSFGSCDSLTEIYFRGNAPSFSDYTFRDVTATAYYPTNDPTWTADVMQDYGGTITWVPYEAGDGGSSGGNPDEGGSSDDSITPETKSGTFYYCNDLLSAVFGREDAMEMKYTFQYDDSWFLKDSTAYNHELARMSIRTAIAAFNTDNIANDNAYYIKALMDQLGYSYDDNSIQYPNPNNWTIGYAIGSKNISEDTSVILAAVRGGGYKGEWYSNCIVGESGDHQGFDEASIQVGDGIAAYINAHTSELKENVKVWIVGYSRGAAVANLAAADLCNGFIEGISSDDVFAYCFACPQGTVDANAASSKYSSIKNIVNPIDLVPKVAMNSWDFTRYGVTYYLPFANDTSDYSTYKAEMQAEYDNILKFNGMEDIEKRTNTVLSLTAESPDQAVAFKEKVDVIAALIGSRSNYAGTSLQGNVAALADELMADGNSLGELIIELLKLIRKECELNPALVMEIIENFSVISKLYPEATAELLNVTNLDTAHYPELYLAWLDSLEGEYKNYNGKYIKVFINCPVDVTVLDEAGNVVGQIVNDEAISIKNGIASYIDRDGQKVLVLPCDAAYEIQLTATDNGTVTYTIEEWDMDSQSSNYVLSYYDLEITEGDVLTGEIPVATEGEATAYMLNDASGEMIEPTKEYSGEEIVAYSIDVVADGHGTAYASPSKIEGEYVIAYATANDGESFLGWYDGENLVSTDENYRFRVESDVALTAKFTSRNHSYENGICSGCGIGSVWNTSTNADYVSVAEALDAAQEGETVQLQADCTEGRVMVTPGVTLDLNGKALAADYAVAFDTAHIIDSAENGRLNVSIRNAVLDEENAMVPAYDGEGYLFTKAGFAIRQDTAYTGDGMKINALAYPVNMDIVELLKDGSADNDIQVMIRLNWDTADGTGSQEFVFTDAVVGDVYSSNNGTWNSYSKMFSMVITGFENIKNLRANMVIVSGTNVQYVSSTSISIT